MANKKRTRNINVYKRRQNILLTVIGIILIIIILIVVYFVAFSDNKEISQDINNNNLSLDNSDSQNAVPADAAEGTLNNSDICFKSDSIEIEVGSKVFPEILNGSIDSITNWESSNSNVAVVSESGEITGVEIGICGITAEIKDSGKMLNLRVDVVEEIEENTTESIGNGDHEVVVEDGITYIDGIMMASKTFSLPKDFDPGVNEEALNAFYEMQEAAADEGLDIYISSSYRSYEDQERIYNSYVEEDGQEAADTYSSRPGHSDHQTGLTFDLNSIDDSFGYTPESDWLKVNAHKYGFIIRYPEGKQEYTGYQYEPWHIRYLGIEKATEVYESGLSLEEFLGVDSVYKD